MKKLMKIQETPKETGPRHGAPLGAPPRHWPPRRAIEAEGNSSAWRSDYNELVAQWPRRNSGAIVIEWDYLNRLNGMRWD